jgi:hypothetical protein
MAAQKIEKPEWQAFFDTLSKGLVGMRAEIEVASLALGDQIVAKWLPLLGITYDPKGDLLEIALDGLDHMIRKPREVYADSANGALLNLEIIDADGLADDPTTRAADAGAADRDWVSQCRRKLTLDRSRARVLLAEGPTRPLDFGGRPGHLRVDL